MSAHGMQEAASAPSSSASSPHAGRVAVVTGGRSGIGEGIVRRLQAEGARVTAFDVVSGPERTDDNPAGGPPVTHMVVDVSQEAEVDAAIDALVAREGRLDYLVCCAAVFYAGGFRETSPERWRRTMDVNVLGPFLCCRAALRHMRPQQYGRIVLFPSMIARRGGANASAYATSKGGVLGLARSLALEVAAENIRVNTLTPGVTDTPQPRGHQTEEELYSKATTIPLGRIGQVEDMLDPCLFLLSEDSSYMTGQDLRVTGGAYLW